MINMAPINWKIKTRKWERLVDNLRIRFRKDLEDI